MGNKFGWHSGVLTCKDIKAQGDVYIQDDIVFSDVSAGVLGITGGIDMQSTTSSIGIDLGGTFSSAAINIDGTGIGGRAILIGTKNVGVPIASGDTLDADYANNYLFGLFSAIESDESTSTDELRSAWIRTRIDDDITIGTATGWGYGVCGAEVQLKSYGATINSWQASALWAQLESQGTTTTFAEGCYASCVLANVGLTPTTVIADGAVVAGVIVNSNTTDSGVTVTGGFYGLYITQKNSALKDFTTGIYIASGSCTTGMHIAGATTAGITMAGDAAYNPIVIGTKSSTTQVGLTMTGVLDNTSGVMIFADDGDAQLGTSYITSPIWTRYMLFHNQTSVTPTGAYFQLKAKKSGGITFTTSDVSATKVYLELDSAVTVASGSLAIINAGLTMNGAVTDTAEALSGIDVNINDGGDALSTTKASTGVRIRKTSGSTGGFPIGLGIEDAGSTIGISIGTCATSIYFNTPSSEFFSFVDDDTFAADAGDKGSTAGGYITVKVGNATRYINLVTGA